MKTIITVEGDYKTTILYILLQAILNKPGTHKATLDQEKHQIIITQDP